MADTRRVLMLPYAHSLARVTRLLEISRGLRARGWEVIFAGTGKHLRLAADGGYSVLPLIEMNPAIVANHTNRASLGFHNRQSIERFVQEELGLFKEVHPTVVVSDFRPTARISTLLADLPYAAVVNAMYTAYYSAWRRAPRTHPLTRVIPERFIYSLLPLVPYINRHYCRPYNAVMRHHGLPECERIEQLFVGDLTLMADVPEYEPTANLPSTFHYIGPLTWEPDLAPPSWLSSLDPGRPTIYFTMGSMGSRDLLAMARDVFASTDYQVLLTTGGIIEADSESWPDNFHVANIAPGGQLMRVSHLLIFHGGNGTAYQALQNGVPMVGIPANLDQEWNVDRLVDLGVAEKLILSKTDGGALLSAASKVLETPSYRLNAESLRDKLRHYDGPRMAADLIEKFAADARREERF